MHETKVDSERDIHMNSSHPDRKVEVTLSSPRPFPTSITVESDMPYLPMFAVVCPDKSSALLTSSG